MYPQQKVFVGAILVIIVGAILFSVFYVVDEGERGVLTRNGRFVAVVDPGLGFKIPGFDKVTKMEIRNMALDFEIQAYSLDTQQYTARVVVNYELDSSEVEKIFKEEGVNYATRRLKPLTETAIKEVSGKFTSQKTIQERDVFGQQVREAIRDAAKGYGVTVTEVQLTNIDFTDQFERAIEIAMLAKAKIEEEKNILEQKKTVAETKVVEAKADAEAARMRAEGEADAKITNAKAEAERITQIGQAEAEAIRKKAEALRDNLGLTAYTYALAAEKWDGKLPTQFVPGSTLPILNVGKDANEGESNK